MTNEQIIQIALKHLLPYDESGELQWWGKEEQLLKFARALYAEGFKVGVEYGYDEGWESSDISAKMNTGSFDDD